MTAPRTAASAADTPAVTVLVAEDEALIRMDLVELLGECGYQVVGQVSDGQAAVDQARALRPDVVLMDVAMPRRDGLSAAEEILAEQIAPVVMVTAFAQRETVERATGAGVFGYLVKPFGKADLTPAIEVAVARWRQLVVLTEQVDSLRERQAAREGVPGWDMWSRRRRMPWFQSCTIPQAASPALP